MSSDVNTIEPGYYSETLDPGLAERLVLRFPDGELIVLPSDDGRLKLELELRGNPNQLPGWKPSIRRSEGILVVADEPYDGVVAIIARVRVPAVFRDIEAHAVSGSIEIRGLSVDLLAYTETGDIRVSGGTSVEASSSAGGVEVEKAFTVNAKLISGALRCREISDSIHAETQSGDVTVEASGGNVVVLSTSGDISVLRPRGRLRVAGGSGDVELELFGRFAGGEISTTTGDVSLALAGSDLELRAETLSGQLDGPGSDQPLSTGPRRCALKVGAGGRRLHVRSVSGDIEIEG
ncbi:MAG: DUF4097 family beta strand repeat-containing protein [Rectinemataceae bacterium]|jgi:DUF4097 and DUF4098 domain-containing protein YvlB